MTKKPPYRYLIVSLYGGIYLTPERHVISSISYRDGKLR